MQILKLVRYSFYRKLWENILLLFSVGLIFPCYSLPSDNQAILHITADQAEYNYRSGKKIFTGHVIITQGSTQVLADKVITYNNQKQQINLAIAYGIKNVATYTTQPDMNAARVTASARVINYYPLTRQAKLAKEVTILQNRNTYHGELIYYNDRLGTITIPAVKNSSAHLTYYPNKAIL